MKKVNQVIIHFILLLILLVFISFTYGQNQQSNTLTPEQQKAIENQKQLEEKYNVIRGPKPPIELDKVPEDAYEMGVLYIKLMPYMDKSFDRRYIYAGNKGYVETGIKSFDEINKAIEAQKYTKIFDALYDMLGSASVKYRERHRAWGFHLWYKIEVCEKADIIQAVRKFETLPDVEIAEPVYKKRLVHNDLNIKSGQESVISRKNSVGRTDGWIPNDELFEQQWHYHNTGQDGGTPGCDIDLIKAWDIETGHSDVKVAIIDAGMQLDHPDLEGNYSGPHWNFVEDSPMLRKHHHATHVAGTVAAVTNNEIGVAGVAGGSGNNDGVSLMNAQVYVTMGTPTNTHLAQVWAADNYAAISQNSWVSDNYQMVDQNAINYFNQNGGGNVMNGGIVIVAAGNEDSSDPSHPYPANYNGVLAVAATDNQDKKASFSNYGSWIDISAPGDKILSTLSSTWNPLEPPPELNGRYGDSTYGHLTGTSMAAPHVSGVAALVISFAHRNGITLSNTDVWNILVNSAECIDHLNPGYEEKLGSGRLNAYYALDYVLCQPKYFENQTVQSDKTINYCHTVVRNVVVSSATLTINSDKAVIEDNVTVENGAKLIINSNNVQIDKNFEAKLGSELVINPN